jgi:tetratricopeptide (TPR) repeat protein
MKVLSFILSIIILALATAATYRYLKQDWLLYRSAEELSRKGAWQQAIPICDELANKGFRTKDTLKLLGRSYEETGDLTMAIDAFRKLLAANPGDAGVELELAGLYDRQGDHAGAADIYLALLAKEPGNRAVALRLARALTALGRYDEAILRYRAILGEKP